jgi:hypothetical protein
MNTPTYAKTKEKKQIDWNQVVEKGIKGKLTEKQKREYSKRSGDWVTCACGSQCWVLDRDVDSEPLDEELSGLGMDFWHQFSSEEYKDAKKTLEKIENRSTLLISKKVSDAIEFIRQVGFDIVKTKNGKAGKDKKTKSTKAKKNKTLTPK